MTLRSAATPLSAGATYTDNDQQGTDHCCQLATVLDQPTTTDTEIIAGFDQLLQQPQPLSLDQVLLAVTRQRASLRQAFLADAVQLLVRHGELWDTLH